MKQDKFSRVLNNKGFYLSLLTGVLAIVAICFVYFGTIGKPQEQNNNITNLNENSNNELVENSQDEQNNTANQPGEENGANNGEEQTPQDQTTSQNNVNNENDALLEHDIVSEPSDEIVGSPTETQENTDTKEDAVTTNQGNAKTLSFDQEHDLIWPVEGNVLIPYDVEHGVPFVTLGQYKTSDAIVIQSEVGTQVKAATTCIIVSIEENEETGTTVTTDVGDGYSIIYGQLDQLNVKKDDVLEAGDVIGTVATPTKYYVIEGPNLYFKVMEDEQSINPLYMLQ